MKYKPNPLLYGACKDFYSSFKLVITMRESVDHSALSRAVARAMTRYPYFCVYPEKIGEDIVLSQNPRPVPVFCDGRCVTLGSDECSGHLLYFGCEGNRITLNASHYIADGMGIDPLLKTVLYLYVSELYGTDGLQTEKILLPGGAVSDEEYAYPFPDAPFNTDGALPTRKLPENVYGLNPDAFDGEGLYAYHLHIPQRAMMSKANPADGSPVSFITVMMYRAFCALDGALELPMVAHVQHQYRYAIKAPINRHSLVSYVPVSLPKKAKNWDVERQNTVLRGQIILGSEVLADLEAVNRIIDAFPSDENATLAQKCAAMREYVERSTAGKTFGISYVGKMDWCGLDLYVKDIHAYIGEKHTKNMMIIEVMTVGEDFTINLMQSGRGRAYVDAFMAELRLMDIPVSLISEERYTLSDTVIPS
jgi:hypothetical protein